MQSLQQIKACNIRIGYESHRDESFLLCDECWYKKLECTTCKKVLFDGKFACDIEPQGNWLDEKCDDCHVENIPQATVSEDWNQY